MKCWRCRRRGIDSTMIKDHGTAYCPNCGREVRYGTSGYRAPSELGCGTKVLFGLLLILLIILLVMANPWLLLLLLIPLIGLVIWAIKSDDNDD